MQRFKRGDIVRMELDTMDTRHDYFHVTHADPNGALWVIGDKDGKQYGLSSNYSKTESATLKQLVDERERREYQSRYKPH